MIMKKEEMKITELYDLTHTLASDYLKQFTYPWEALAGLSDFIIELGKSLDPAEYEKRGENIWVHKTAKVFDSAYLHGPVIVGKDAEVRHCAFIRGSALIGEGAVVGNSYRSQNVILSDKDRYWVLCSMPGDSTRVIIHKSGFHQFQRNQDNFWVEITPKMQKIKLFLKKNCAMLRQG